MTVAFVALFTVSLVPLALLAAATAPWEVAGPIAIPAGTYSGIALSRLLSGATWDGTVEHWVLADDGRPTASFSLTKRLVSFRLSIIHRPVALPSLDVTPFSSWVHDVVEWWWSALEEAASFDWLIGRASAVNRFAVFNDAQCTVTLVSTDADCWSTTTGGNGDGAPVSGDSLVLDTGVTPFTATGTMDANLSLGAQTVTVCSAAGAPIAACGGNFQGTFAISTFSLTFTGAFQMNDSGGTVSISTGTINGGSATFTTASDLSITGAASVTFDDMTVVAGTYAKGTSTLTLDGTGTALTMSGGDLTSTSGAVSITGSVSISTSSAIDFGSETWTVSGSWDNNTTDAAVWDEGTGTMIFNSSTDQPMDFAAAAIGTDPEFYNVTFNSTSASPVVFGNVSPTPVDGLGWARVLTVEDSVSTTTLNVEAYRGGTPSWGVAGNGILRVGNGGIATASIATDTFIQGLEMTGGTSGTFTFLAGSGMTIRNGAVADAGRGWNTSGAGSVLNEGTALITFRFPSVITLLSTDNTLNSVTIDTSAPSLTTTLASSLVVTGSLTLLTGTFAKGTQTLTAGSLTMSGGDLTSTSGDVTVNGAVNVSSASSSIDFGSEIWTVTGTWTNSSTEAAWDAGTGTMTYTSPTGGTMTFAGSNLAESEFNHVTFNSSAGTAQTFTMATRSLRIGGTFTVTDTSSTTAVTTSNLNVQANSIQVETSGSVTVGTGDFLTVATFNIDGSLTMDGQTVGNIFFSASSGTMDVTLWTAWQVGADVDVRWTFNPSVAAATVTITLESVTAGTDYDLTRDGGSVSTVTPSGTTVTFAVAGGWSSRTMAIDESVISAVGGTKITVFCQTTPQLFFQVRLYCAASGDVGTSYNWYLDGTWVGSGPVLDVVLTDLRPLARSAVVSLNVGFPAGPLIVRNADVPLDFRLNLLTYGLLAAVGAIILAALKPSRKRHLVVLLPGVRPRR